MGLLIALVIVAFWFLIGAFVCGFANIDGKNAFCPHIRWAVLWPFIIIFSVAFIVVPNIFSRIYHLGINKGERIRDYFEK